jgi:hypothetical protein
MSSATGLTVRSYCVDCLQNMVTSVVICSGYKMWVLCISSTGVSSSFQVCGTLTSPFKDEAQTALFKDPVRTAL